MVGVKVGGDNVGILMYADDIVIVTESVEGMKSALKEVHLVGKEYGMVFNEKKSKIMRWGKRKTEERVNWEVGEKRIEETDEYKYLGVKFTGGVRGEIGDLGGKVKEVGRVAGLLKYIGGQAGAVSYTHLTLPTNREV